MSVVLASDIDADSVLRVVRELQGYEKSTSIAWFRALRIPTLEAVMLNEWTSEAERACGRVFRKWSRQEVLVRIDQHGCRWTRRRGGYIISNTEVPDTVRELRRDNILTILLEPKNALDDLHSLAGVVDPERQTISVEVVGPGFDASDLMRGDVLAHERIELFVPNLEDPTSAYTTTEHHLISAEDYPISVEQRLAKIGARLMNREHPEILFRKESQRYVLARQAEAFLRESGHTLLFEHRHEYKCISAYMLRSFIQGIRRTYEGLWRYGRRLGVACFSASVVDVGLVFWDYFAAPNAYLKGSVR